MCKYCKKLKEIKDLEESRYLSIIDSWKRRDRYARKLVELFAYNFEHLDLKSQLDLLVQADHFINTTFVGK